MKNIEALIADGGEITLGAISGIECAATAADGHNCLAMLVRREGETLNSLLRRLDKADRDGLEWRRSHRRDQRPRARRGARQEGTAS